MDNAQSKRICGELFEKMVISGANNLKANLKIVNDLNVFPIPDGDTGDNMFMTVSGGISALKNSEGGSLCQKARALADGMLLNARGNSGVILSQLFAGLADGLKGYEEATVNEFGSALKCGVCKAYSSVSHPVEGTMLTVAREATDLACAKCGDNGTIGGFFAAYIAEMKSSLDRTPDLLEALKEAGVIDSGGAGLVYIAEGMKLAIDGKEVGAVGGEIAKAQDIDFSRFNENSVMKYGYCTEMLVQLTNSKGGVERFNLDELIAFLEGLGDSVVAFRTGNVVKLHVHTMTPYKVMEYCHGYGEFLTLKVENMTLQHNGIESVEEEKKPKRVRPRRRFALVTVANGDGIIDVFKECGADEVIDGGQGRNPSIERFIEAFDQVNADTVFVLPNNGNIIMAAKQAAEIYQKSEIVVVETKNIGQAYSILSMLDYSSNDTAQILELMKSDMCDVVTGQVSTSVRDATIDGVEIKKGEYIGFSDKKMICSKQDKVDSLKALCESLNSNERDFVLVFYGEEISEEQKSEVANYFAQTHKNTEFYPIDGGQEVYDFIVVLQ